MPYADGVDVALLEREEPLQGFHPYYVQGLLEIKDTHRPWEGPMLLGIALP